MDAGDRTAEGTGGRSLLGSSGSRPIRYLLVGGWNTAFGYLAFVGFYEVTRRLGIHYLFATVPATICGVANTYFTQRHLVFGTASSVRRSLPRFLFVQLVLYLVNTPLLALLSSGLGLDPRIASAILLLGNASFSYIAHLHWTFVPRKPGSSG